MEQGLLSTGKIIDTGFGLIGLRIELILEEKLLIKSELIDK